MHHSCEIMGHQMRVFAGGHFKSENGKVYPSLRTCDMINPYSKVNIDDSNFIWKDILENQLRSWQVNYKKGDKNMQ